MLGTEVNFFEKNNVNNQEAPVVDSNSLDFDFISIGVASEEQILSWSYGEVKSSDTMNYRTFKPERDGLFCAKIFGPVKKYECLCGKYKRKKYKGIICEKCGTEVTDNVVRRERMGHIKLATPVVNVLFLRPLPSRISSILDISLKNLEKILSYDLYIVYDIGNTTMKKFQLLSESENEIALQHFGSSAFKAEKGGLGIKLALESIVIDEELDNVKNQISKITNTAQESYKSLKKRLNILQDIKNSGINLTNLVPQVLPVLPPDLRPLVPLDGGRFASSDLNDLYRRIINRNNRLKKLIELRAPDVIVVNEKRMLQEAVDQLIYNSSGNMNKVAKSLQGRPLKSITDSLKGKQGRFRQNLLGKRVDYSGRSVIVVGPNLKLNECGLPKKMALELFRPFVISRLRLSGQAISTRAADLMIENEDPEVFDVLEEVVRDHPVLLNRAPSLHRLSVQAFEPKLIQGKAIQIHPLVCKAFNADFDGDQMAVHIPLSLQAQLEAKLLMLSSNNIISPADGSVIISLKKDPAAGIFYLTSWFEDAKGKGREFYSYYDVLRAIDSEIITEQTPIKYYFSYDNDDKLNSVETTAGRVLLFEILPHDGKIKFEDINISWDVEKISKITEKVRANYGIKKTVDFCDNIMKLGFKYNTKSGLSLSKDDIVIPDSKNKYISESIKKIEQFNDEYNSGLITKLEKRNKTIDEWFACDKKITDEMMSEIFKNDSNSNRSCISDIMNSGSRASPTQLKQLGGMRGLISKSSGELIETPILSNFKEGLNVVEYFNSAHGARKGNVDTALKTAEAGYLTRRLVDVCQDCVILEEDCLTDEYITYSTVTEEGFVRKDLHKLFFGRVIAKDFHLNGKLLFSKNQFVDTSVIEDIEKFKISTLELRSVITCKAARGACAHCYGYDIISDKLIEIGEPVGVVAAQSIGEPGTQLTLRTFYIGGAASKEYINTSIVTDADCIVEYDDSSSEFFIRSKDDDSFIFIGSSIDISLFDKNKSLIRRAKVPSGAKIFCKNKDSVVANFEVAKWDCYNSYIIAEKDGYIKYIDLIQGLSLKDTIDELGNVNKVVSNWLQDSSSSIFPSIAIVDKNGGPILDKFGNEILYKLSPGVVILKSEGEAVKAGEFIGKQSNEIVALKQDITGGLPRVEEIFEARSPKSPAIVAPFDGHLYFVNSTALKIKLILKGLNGEERTFVISKDKFIPFRNGSFVAKYSVILKGDTDLQNLLDIEGLNGLVPYFTNEIKKVYSSQGAEIKQTHIEVVLRHMLDKVEILDGGDSLFINGSKYSIDRVREENDKILNQGKKPASIRRIISGITKSSLSTSSFLSAASFQETIKVLVDASLRNTVDELKGMKENIIVGRLIPAGTGYVYSALKKAAAKYKLEENNTENKEEISDVIK